MFRLGQFEKIESGLKRKFKSWIRETGVRYYHRAPFYFV
ncbi:hypothetical protein LEP1GSC150_2914 [Leptospira interrogans serovar Copenhageni str. LT2050]|uniref:Uncharacterized protein n=1 Tax=Leptospira interrogans serovar Copenhageni str. LT2050 TaxID=1001598 RepID=M3HG31_LEPIT|nr:hypothetical protein LEP1GSC150_2914 [Leptospira interrogans serovar Copenhageni str. LT2050]